MRAFAKTYLSTIKEFHTTNYQYSIYGYFYLLYAHHQHSHVQVPNLIAFIICTTIGHNGQQNYLFTTVQNLHYYALFINGFWGELFEVDCLFSQMHIEKQQYFPSKPFNYFIYVYGLCKKKKIMPTVRYTCSWEE